MGFLDKFLSKDAQNQIKGIVKNAADKAESAIKTAQTQAQEYIEQNQKRSEAANAPSATPSPAPAAPARAAVTLKVKHNEVFSNDASAIPGDVADHGSAAYFADVIRKNLPGAEVTLNAPIDTVTSPVSAKTIPISVLVTNGGSPALAIILTKKNSYRNPSVINTMNACEDAGIPAIRFMKEFSNEAPYVVGRIKAVIK